MPNSIQPTPIGLPADLVNIELPRSIAQATTTVTPVQHQADASLSTNQQTAGSPHQPASLERMLDQINDSMRAWATGIRFDIDKDVERIVISIVDNSSGEVIRTMPTEAVLKIARMIVQLQGTGVDTQA